MYLYYQSYFKFFKNKFYTSSKHVYFYIKELCQETKQKFQYLYIKKDEINFGCLKYSYLKPKTIFKIFWLIQFYNIKQFQRSFNESFSLFLFYWIHKTYLQTTSTATLGLILLQFWQKNITVEIVFEIKSQLTANPYNQL